MLWSSNGRVSTGGIWNSRPAGIRETFLDEVPEPIFISRERLKKKRFELRFGNHFICFPGKFVNLKTIRDKTIVIRLKHIRPD
jgi:hypothetical protein